MRELVRITMLVVIFCVASAGWLFLGGVMMARSDSQERALHGAVADLWGQPLSQSAPTAQYSWIEHYDRFESARDAKGNLVYENGKPVQIAIPDTRPASRDLALAATDVDVTLTLDQRRKGLMWFPLYDVGFAGRYRIEVDGDEPNGTLWLTFQFPFADGVYDDFQFTVDGVEMADLHPPVNGQVQVPVPTSPGDTVEFTVAYRSRGMTEWSYRPSTGVAQLRDFDLHMSTDFADIDFPGFTLSPSSKSRTDAGWTLDWTFSRLVTGHGMGMVMPEPVQPGPLAASMSFSAPISLGLFMLWIYVLGLLRNIDIHPVNHLFLAATFFSFHLLFGYTTDHIPVEWAFALSSVVSLFLTISYLRLVAGPRFATFEAGGAQLLYLVGFSLAHFWDGFTGLTVTVLGILTLFALGQLTGRIRWSDVFRGPVRTPTVTAAG
ncbi:MAG: hypothetical protein R3F61_14155 [Myxococcota bacterium]